MAQHNLNENYNGSTKLREWWTIVHENFTSLLTWLNGHINGTADRHRAEDIDYDAARTLKKAVDDETNARVASCDSLYEQISDETTAREDADTAINNAISQLWNAMPGEEETDVSFSNLRIYYDRRIETFHDCDALKTVGYHYIIFSVPECVGAPSELGNGNYEAIVQTLSPRTVGGADSYFIECRQTLTLLPKGSAEYAGIAWERDVYQVNDEDMKETPWAQRSGEVKAEFVNRDSTVEINVIEQNDNTVKCEIDLSNAHVDTKAFISYDKLLLGKYTFNIYASDDRTYTAYLEYNPYKSDKRIYVDDSLDFSSNVDVDGTVQFKVCKFTFENVSTENINVVVTETYCRERVNTLSIIGCYLERLNSDNRSLEDTVSDLKQSVTLIEDSLGTLSDELDAVNGVTS